jgi:hydrogenase maturation protease
MQKLLIMREKSLMKKLGLKRHLVIGIGNDSRQDDGLGWALLDKIEEKFPGETELVYRYQLNIEDADLIKDADCVLFVDACENQIEQGSAIEPCTPNGEITYTTHALSPAAVLALCNQVYDENPEAYVLSMQGYEWELETGLTDRGRQNLERGFQLYCDFTLQN